MNAEARGSSNDAVPPGTIRHGLTYFTTQVILDAMSELKVATSSGRTRVPRSERWQDRTAVRRQRRAARRYRRAVRWAFARVSFYREQWASAGRVLAEPEPTPVAAVPDPPHALCPFSRPWSGEREPSLWTPTGLPLARVLRAAGCRGRAPVLEVRESLVDRTRLPRPHRLAPPGPAYRVLLSTTAVVASPERRDELNREALAVLGPAGSGWVVAGPDEWAALPEAADPRLRPVLRLPVAAAADPAAVADPAATATAGPVVLYEPVLGYLGALVPACGRFHLDSPRVYARGRDGVVTFSLPGSRRPVLLEIVPPGADGLSVTTCPRHGTPVLRPRTATTTA